MTDETKETLIALTRDMVLIPSSAERPAERERCFAFVHHHVDRVAGVNTREIRKDGVPALLALPTGVDRPDVLMCGHLDVIHHPEVEVYNSCVEEGRIIGPGAGDMKAALAVMLEVFHQFHDRRPGVPLRRLSLEQLSMVYEAAIEAAGLAGVQPGCREPGI